MPISYHRQVQTDVNQALDYYYKINRQLGDDFYDELMAGIGKVVGNPKICHFDQSGLRRCNLEKFPYHFLYDIKGEMVRVWVLRHDHKSPAFGTKRFKR